MSRSTSQPTAQFAVGELVVITGTGLSWDGQIAAVMSIERVNPLDENDTIVFVERLDEDGQNGRGRGCYLPASQLRPAPQPPAHPKPAHSTSRPKDPQEKPSESAPRFSPGQRVRIIANQGGLYGAQIGVTGVIERQRQYRRFGYHTYDVGYQDEKGHDKLVTAVREDDLEAVTGDEASVPENARPVTDSAASVTTAKPTKPSDKLPLFAKGEHITVDPRSELCYETFTRKGAVGVIMRADKAVRGIRRYQVLFEVPHLGGRRATRIREEHLLRAEPPAPSEPPHDDGWGTWDDDAPMKAKEQADDAAYTAAYGDERPSRPVTPAVTPATCDHTWQVYHNHGSHRRCTTCGRHEATCEHDWFLWPDGRYRHCPKCKLSERVPAAQNEVAR